MTPKPHRFIWLILAGFALSGAALADNLDATPPVAAPETPLIDPVAMQALERMGAALRDLTTFSLRADDAVDVVLESGQTIQHTKTVELQARKPNRLRADITTDRKARELFYDGQHFTLRSPDAGYFATVAAPPTIREMLAALETKYDIDFPLLDLFVWGEDAEATAAIQAATWIGTSQIDGQLADQYAFREEEIDWQIWIAQGATPLPLRYVITSKNEPGAPQFVANLHWDTTAKPDDVIFTFVPGPNDHPIAIITQDAAPTTP